MVALRLIILTLSFMATSTATTTVTSTNHNITDILMKFPEYSDFNKYLTETKLDDEINNRQSITVLVFNNTIVSEFLSNKSLSTIKVALSIHVLLDYFDLKKLQNIGGGSMTTTTLYQTTGTAVGNTGFVNITDLVGGKVGFGSGGSGSRLDALYFRSVKQIPYNLSVLEINSPIIAPGILTAAPSSNANISGLLENAGCKKFARLISDSGVLKVYQTVEPRGLTVFAPTDEAFKAFGMPDFGKLTDAERISLLLYHAIAGYFPKVSLMTEKNQMKTLASNELAEFGLTIRSNGDSVTLDSGVDDSRVESTVVDSVPLSVFKIDHVLLPAGYITGSPSPAPVPVPAPEATTSSPPCPPSLHAPAPVSVPSAPPAHTPIASSPAPVAATSPIVSPPAPPQSPSSPPASSSSPPAPPASSPESGPAPAPVDGPTADTGSSNASGGIKAPVVLLALTTVMVSGIISSIVG